MIVYSAWRVGDSRLTRNTVALQCGSM